MLHRRSHSGTAQATRPGVFARVRHPAVANDRCANHFRTVELATSPIFRLLLLMAMMGWPFPFPVSCAAQEMAQRGVPDAEIIGRHIAWLAAPEQRGRAGVDAWRASEYIAQRFSELKLRPVFGDSYFQEIHAPGEGSSPQRLLGRNVAGWLEGSDPQLSREFLILGVHHDHLGTRDGETFAGADDNASGVAMMLEVARSFATGAERPRRSLMFVGFDLEEHMLWGSRWFVAHPPQPLNQVKLFITADMIGRSLGDLPLPAVFVLGSEHAPRLKSTLDRVETPPGLEVARLGVDLIGTRSDYGPFRDQQIPFLFFSTGEHPDYHSPRDVPEKIDTRKVAAISQVVMQVMRRTAADDESPVWTDAVKGDLDEARALQRITTLLLESQGPVPLSDVQRYFVSSIRKRTSKILAANVMTDDDRTWLVRMSQLLLFSVF